MENATRKKKLFTTRSLVISAASIALAFALSFVTFFRMPQGGSVNLCSMLFVALPGYFFGPAIGFVTAVTYGLLNFVFDSVMYHPAQVLLDYILGFGILGVTGFFANKKFGLINGYILGVAGRFVFSTLSGVLFFYMYAGEQNVWIYSMGYQAVYLGPEAAITAVVLAVPAVQHGIELVKRRATL